SRLMSTSSASSSMHSWSMMVESMSAMSSFLRRPLAGWTAKSTGAPSSAKAIVPSTSVCCRSGFKCRSQAMPSSSQTNLLAPTASRTLFARGADSARPEGLQTRVATIGMEIAEADRKEALGGAILIAGPTASGKSALALRLAAELDGVIVNTDSMQVYSVLDRLTARPRPEDLLRAPHELYGHVHPSEVYSTGRWLREVRELIATDALRHRRPI